MGRGQRCSIYWGSRTAWRSYFSLMGPGIEFRQSGWVASACLDLVSHFYGPKYSLVSVSVMFRFNFRASEVRSRTDSIWSSFEDSMFLNVPEEHGTPSVRHLKWTQKHGSQMIVCWCSLDYNGEPEPWELQALGLWGSWRGTIAPPGIFTGAILAVLRLFLRGWLPSTIHLAVTTGQLGWLYEPRKYTFACLKHCFH